MCVTNQPLKNLLAASLTWGTLGSTDSFNTLEISTYMSMWTCLFERNLNRRKNLHCYTLSSFYDSCVCFIAFSFSIHIFLFGPSESIVQIPNPLCFNTIHTLYKSKHTVLLKHINLATSHSDGTFI